MSAGRPPEPPPRENADCYRLDEHRDQWILAEYWASPRGRWVCPICHPEDFEDA